MLAANASWPPARLSGASARPLLALVAVLAVVLACGATPRFLKTAPARELQLGIQLDNALAAGEAPVHMSVRVSDLSRGGFVALSGGQRLTCGGVSDPVDEANGSSWDVAQFVVPRQPPGGAYTCVYTDERGIQTTATVPVPVAPLAFTSPTAGAHVPLPTPAANQAITTPLATASASPSPALVSQPLVVHYTVPVPPGYAPLLPGQPFTPVAGNPYGTFADQGPHALVTVQAGWGPPPLAPLACVEQCGSWQAATGTYLLSHVPTSSPEGGAQTIPGPGYLMLNLAMQWSPPAGGFHAILVDSQDSVTISITWITPQSGSAGTVRA